jgi:hypothetical protein
VANSFDSRDGPISELGPDLALVQLSLDGGELPPECEVKLAEGQQDLARRAIGMLGFWGVNEPAWPAPGAPAKANLTVSLLREAGSDFRRAHAPYNSLLYCDFRVEDMGGASGGPIFLDDGRVVGLIVAVTYEAKMSDRFGELIGLPLEGLRELIGYYGLGGVMPTPLKPVVPRLDWGPDPRLRELRRLVRLVRRAAELRRMRQFRDAVEICNYVLADSPEYGGALLERSKAYLFYLGMYWPELAPENRRKFAHWALADSDRCNELNPLPNYPRLIHIQNIVYDSCACADPSGLRYVVERTSQILDLGWQGDPPSSWERSFALNLRAQAHHLLGEMESAEADYAESIRLGPSEPRWYLNRAQFWDQQKRADLARADRTMADALTSMRAGAGAKSVEE